MQIHQIKQKIVPILLKHKITKAAIFGSYARGEATSKSDLDILVDLSVRISLLDFVGIKLELEDELGKSRFGRIQCSKALAERTDF